MRALHRRPIRTRLYALILLEFLFGIVYGVFSLTLPILAEQLILNVALLGVVFALPEIFGTIFDVPIGEFARRFGRRRTIFYSGLLLASSALAFIALKNPIIFIATLILYEIATQSFIIPGDAEETALTPARSTGRFRSILEGMHNLGFSFGPIIAGAVIGFQIEYAFLIAFFVSILMMSVSFIFVPREEEREGFWKAATHIVTRDKLFTNGIVEFLKLGFEGLFVAFIFFSFALHWGFIALMEPLYTKQLGLPEWQMGFIYAGFTLPIFFVGIFVGRYLDHKSAKGVTIAGLFLHALSAFGFSLTKDPNLLFILSLVSGVGDALLLPAIYTMFDRLSSYHKQEYIAGIKVSGESFGYFLGPLLGGVVAWFIGFQGTFAVLGVFLLILTVITAFVPLRVSRPVESV